MTTDLWMLAATALLAAVLPLVYGAGQRGTSARPIRS